MQDKLIRNNTIDSSDNKLKNEGLQWNNLRIITKIIFITSFIFILKYEI